MTAEDKVRELLKGTRLEAPARTLVEWRRPGWRRDRLDNQRLKLLIAYLLREDSCAVDVGSHKGMFLREMLRVAPKGHHVAFEALPELAEPLAAELPEATVYAAAAGETAGSMTFMRNKTVLAQSGMMGRREVGGQDLEEITVPVLTLDEVLTDPPVLIKIDVEGAEGYVLRGAKQILAEHRPIVWFENGPVAARECGTEPGDIYDVFQEAGMRIFDVDGRGPLSLSEFSSPPPLTWTYIAR